jgi:hypothetical protein
MTHTVESYTKEQAEAMIGKRTILRVSFGQVLRAGNSGTVIDTYPRDGGTG